MNNRMIECMGYEFTREELEEHRKRLEEDIEFLKQRIQDHRAYLKIFEKEIEITKESGDAKTLEEQKRIDRTPTS